MLFHHVRHCCCCKILIKIEQIRREKTKQCNTYSEIPDEKPFWWESTLMKGHLFWNLSLRVSMEMKSSPRTTPLSATFVRLLGLSLKIGSTVPLWNYWESIYQICFSACKDKGIIFTHILISSWDTTDGYTFTRQQHSFTIKKKEETIWTPKHPEFCGHVFAEYTDLCSWYAMSWNW